MTKEKISNKIKLKALLDIYSELEAAEKQHPNWPENPFEALAIITEELGELSQALLQYKHEGGLSEAIRAEAIHVTAMGFRFIINIR